MPAISVVMSVYQDTRFLQEAVQSILDQTFEDFELIVIDDGSDDPAPARALEALDPRIRTMANETNLGIPAAANKAIAEARAPIIARLDSDDISLPGRLQALWDAYEQEPELALVASNYIAMNEDGEPLRHIIGPEQHRDIVWAALFFDPIGHSSASFRKTIFEAVNGYDEGYEIAEDYHLWMRILRIGRARILQEPLVLYRVHPQGITARKADRMQLLARNILREAWTWLDVELPEYFEPICALASGHRWKNPEQHQKIMNEYLALYSRALPRLTHVFPTLTESDVITLGRRLLEEARHSLIVNGSE